MATFAKALADLIRQLQDDEGVLTPAELDEFVVDGVKHLQVMVPRLLVVKVPGDDSFSYAVPTGWVTNFSVIREIYHPWDPNQQQLDRDRREHGDDYILFRDDTGDRIRFITETPKTGDDFLIQFLAPHEAVKGSDLLTLPDFALPALALCTSSLAALAIAAHFNELIDNVIQSDVTEFRTKSDQWRKQSKMFWDRYNEVAKRLPVFEDAGLGAIVDWDALGSVGQEPLTHGRRNR